MADRRVRLYSLSTCPVCRKTAALLEEMGVEFVKTDVDLLESGEQWVTMKEVRRVNADGTFPTLIVERVIVGFREREIREALA